ncbi:MAG: hypothetical protein HY063_13985 [Bacteroidetes bacterium]|nr:hypothetical protein [Bacteroidota bacterium]
MKKKTMTAGELSRIIILLAATKKNLPKIVVLSDISLLTVTDAVSEVKGVVFTGDADATNPPVPDGTAHAQADTLLNIHTKRQTVPPTATAAQETEQRNIVNETYRLNAVYAQGVARAVAKAQGDVNAGIAVVLRLGLKLKSKNTGTKPDFGQIKSGPGTLHLHAKKMEKSKTEAHLWQYAGVPNNKTVPAAAQLKTRVTPQTDVIFSDLDSGALVAARHASIGTARKGKSQKTHHTTKTSEKSVSSSSEISGHHVFSDKMDDPYTWTAFEYFSVG